jgi:hypothetical protein
VCRLGCIGGCPRRRTIALFDDVIFIYQQINGVDKLQMHPRFSGCNQHRPEVFVIAYDRINAWRKRAFVWKVSQTFSTGAINEVGQAIQIQSFVVVIVSGHDHIGAPASEWPLHFTK